MPTDPQPDPMRWYRARLTRVGPSARSWLALGSPERARRAAEADLPRRLHRFVHVYVVETPPMPRPRD